MKRMEPGSLCMVSPASFISSSLRSHTTMFLSATPVFLSPPATAPMMEPKCMV